MDKGKWGGWKKFINKFLSVNIINFAKVDKGGGLIHKKVDNLLVVFLEPFPYSLS